MNIKRNAIALCALSVGLMSHPASAVYELGSNVSMYGFILPNVIYGSRGVETFSNPNPSAFTAAANPVTGGDIITNNPNQYNRENLSFLSFQVAQSRFGFLFGEKNKLRGRLEFDLFDSTKSSPTTGSLPRIRRATVELPLYENGKLIVGQDWDLFSPLLPHTYNVVGHYFMSGSVGFMRQQVQYIHETQESEAGVAVGLQGSNNASKDAGVEIAKVPTFSARFQVKPNAKSRIGVSGIITNLLLDPVNQIRRTSYGVTAHTDLYSADESFNVRAEVYGGRNLNNIGTFALSFATPTTDVSELGGFITAKLKTSPAQGIYAGFGLAKILNPSGMTASYSGAGASAIASPGSFGPGLEKNWTARVGTDYKVDPRANWFLEVAYLNSTHHLSATDMKTYSPLNLSWVAFSGVMMEL